MKRPTKNQIQLLRIALGMSGAIAISDYCADMILTTQGEMKRLKGKFSLRDACSLEIEVRKTYFKEKE